MVNSELQKYIAAQKAVGTPDDKIKSTLVAAGWQLADVTDSMATNAPVATVVAPSMANPGMQPVSAAATSMAAAQPTVAVAQPMVSQFGGPNSSVGVQPPYTAGPMTTNGLPPLGAQPEPTQQQPGAPKQKKSSVVQAMVVLLFLVLLGAGGVYAYTQYTAYMENPYRVLAEAAKQPPYTSLDYEVKASVSAKTNDVTKAVQVSFSGSADSANKKGSATVTIQGDDIPEPVSGEIIVFPQNVYIKLLSIPDPKIQGLDIAQLTNKWISTTLTETSGAIGQDLPATATYSAEEQKKLSAAFIADPFIEFSENKPTGDALGAETYHYTYTVNKAKLVSFLDNANTYLEEKNKITDDQLESTKKSIAEIDIAEGELWVGKTDYRVRKLTMRVVTKDETAMQMSILMSNFDAIDAITEPTEAVTLKELMEQMMPTATPTPTITPSVKVTTTPILKK